MELKIFNTDRNEFPVVTSNQPQTRGEELFRRCVDDITHARKDTAKTANDNSAVPTVDSAAALLQCHLGVRVNLKDHASGLAILESTPEQQVAIVLAAMASVVKQRYSDATLDRVSDACLKSLLRRKLPYQEADLNRMLALVVQDSIAISTLPLGAIFANIARCTSNGVSRSIRSQLQRLSKTYYPEAYTADERKIGVRIQQILKRETSDSPGNPSPTRPSGSAESTTLRPPKFPTSFDLNTGEAWSAALLIELEKLSDEARLNWHQLLEHCRLAKPSKPTQKWTKRTNQLLDSIGTAEFISVASPAFTAVGQAGECQKFNHGGRISFGHETQVHDTHVDRLRGLVWTTSLIDDENLIGIVGGMAEKCFQKIRDIGPRCPKVGNACLLALSSLATNSAIAQLGRLQSRAKHVSTRKQITRAFERAADNAGMSPDDLVELGVPRFGLTEPGRYSQPVGQFTAELVLHANRKTGLTWVRPDGKTQKTIPSAVKSEHAEALKDLKKRAKDIDSLMPSIRARVEQLARSPRRWSITDFRARFLDHPVVGVVARRLIWNLHRNGETIPAAWKENKFVDCDDNVVAVDENTTEITFWHPMQSEPRHVLRWRDWIEANEYRQPFKQAHREVYILTDAERTTEIYSNRFAAHIIRQHQFAALCHQRGWRFNLQGDWDSWNAPVIDLPQHRLRVEFIVEPLETFNQTTDNLIYTHLATDQVRFFQRMDDSQPDAFAPVALEEIDPLVFSETMRDVDLFVGVCSIGNDPFWIDHGEPHADYWHQFSFGKLSQTAESRKQMLRKVIPNLDISKRCRFEDRFLVVQGKLRSYKIHLGSGNILMSPNDQYLCIIQKRDSGTRRTDNIFLPFEGDNTLSLILSKAFLLVDDDKIKDQTIVNQIRLDRE